MKYRPLDRLGNKGLNVNYYGGIDYSSVPGEPIFINSNLILRKAAVSWKKAEERQKQETMIFGNQTKLNQRGLL